MSDFHIRSASDDAGEAGALADVLIDAVAGGASVGFMHPLSREKAVAFWRQCQTGATRGERVLLVAEERSSKSLVGTVQVILSAPENGPHRGEVAKMLVHSRARRRGLGAELMRAAEAAAREAGKTLLVLDTAAGSDAERLYTRLGWVRAGEIPAYALKPRGGLCATTVFYRALDR